MAFCTKCGAQNAEGVGFCTTCGNPLVIAQAAPAAPPASPPFGMPVAPPAAPPFGAPMAAPPFGTPAAPMMYQAAPVAPAQPGFLAVFWNSLDVGARIAGIGAIVAVFGFMFPLSGFGDGSWNGFKYAISSGGDMSYWFRFLLPLGVLALVYVSYNKDLRTKIMTATAQCAVGSIWGFQILRVVTGSDYARYLQFGWYAHTLGLLAIAVGGFMSIMDLTNRLRGVR